MNGNGEVLLRWADVVVSTGPRGREEVLIAAADLEVRAGETLWIDAPERRSRQALVDVLTGARRPLYGAVTGVARPGTDGVRLVLAEAASGLPAIGSAAALIVVTAGGHSPVDAVGVRRLVVTDGALLRAGHDGPARVPGVAAVAAEGFRRVGVGVIGAGSAGGQHLAALAAHPYAVPVAFCDTEPAAVAARLSWCAERPGLGAVRGLPGAAEMLADERVELVAVATPPGSHEELAVAALEAGRGVLVEKPPLLTVAALDRVLAAAERAGRPAGAMLQHRFRLPAGARSQTWGPATVAAVEVVRHRPAPHWNRAAWRTDPADSGGGMLAHLGVHYLDLACQVLGVPTSLVAEVDPVAGSPIDERVSLTAAFAGGARLVFIGSTAVDRRSERLAVFDSGRSLILDGDTTAYEDSASGHAAPETARPTPALRADVFTDLAVAVRERRSPAVADLASARGVVHILETLQSVAVAS